MNHLLIKLVGVARGAWGRPAERDGAMRQVFPVRVCASIAGSGDAPPINTQWAERRSHFMPLGNERAVAMTATPFLVGRAEWISW